MLCKNCGNELPDYAKFCTKCGTAIESAAEDASTPEEAADAAQATSAPEAEAAPVSADPGATVPLTAAAPEAAPAPQAAPEAASAPAAYAAPAAATAPNTAAYAAPAAAAAAAPAAAAATAYAYSASAGATYAMPADPYDHTARFAPQEVSDGKLYAMMCYLMSWLGIIVALLAAKENGYVSFHVRQALKMTVVDTLLGIIAALLIWTIIVPIAAGVCLLIVFVLRIICFFQVCSGKAKEPAIIRSLNFLK